MPQRKVVIVGCGYVGSALATVLAGRGDDVVATTTTPGRCEGLAHLGARPVVVELEQVQELHATLCDRETVFLTVGPGQHGSDYRRVYLEGVTQLLQAARGTEVRRIIYASSTSVYGQEDGSWVDEGSATDPSSESGRILLAAERALIGGAQELGIVATVLRLGGIWGPGRSPSEWACRYAGRERTDGEAYLNLIHRDDIVAAMMALLETEYAGLLNLSGDEPVVRRTFYDRLIEESGAAPIRWTGGAGRVRRGKRVRNERIKRILNLRLEYPTCEVHVGGRGAETR